MKPLLRLVMTIVAIGLGAVALPAWLRINRVNRAAAEIPLYPGTREAGGRIRYFPRLLSWDDRSSARVQRVFAISQTTNLIDIARRAEPTLATRGWYLVMPDNLDRLQNAQIIVWQREPDERLDLSQLWPLSGMDRTQRLYGGIFPAEFLDAPLVIEWSWALGGPRSARPSPPSGTIVRPAPPPTPPR